MRKATNKDNYTKVEILGQYNTKIEGIDKIISELAANVADARESAKLICTKGF